jgi:hypothetical protein
MLLHRMAILINSALPASNLPDRSLALIQLLQELNLAKIFTYLRQEEVYKIDKR